MSPRLSGSENMGTDLKLFHDFEKDIIPSTLRIYSWKPKCISLGYAQRIEKLIDEKRVKELGWDVVKRPTGGGIVFHNEAEVTYSLVTEIDNPLLPDGLISSYIRLSEAVVLGLKKIKVKAEISQQKAESGKPLDFSRQSSGQVARGKQKAALCFSYPAEYEIVVNGKKIVGSAQKRGKRALLQQGSIFVSNTTNGAFSVLKKPYDKENVISIEEILDRRITFEELSRAIIEGFEKVLKINLVMAERK